MNRAMKLEKLIVTEKVEHNNGMRNELKRRFKLNLEN